MTDTAIGRKGRGAAQLYADHLRRAASDPNVAGALLTGSRAADAFVTDQSDFDAYVILHAEASDWHTPTGASVEVWPMTVREFRVHGLIGSPTEWDRPTFLYARVEFDMLDGEIARITDQKRRLSAEEVQRVVPEALGAYIYALARSLRNIAAGRILEGRLEAMESLSPMLTVAFALEARVRPFNKWLLYELRRRPLPISGFLGRVRRICDHAASVDQVGMLTVIEARARQVGFTAAVDAWRHEFPDLP